jgi:hypothetical protein
MTEGKKNYGLWVVLAVVALIAIIGIYFLATGGVKVPQFGGVGSSCKNGVFDKASGECKPQSTCKETAIFTCCYNKEGQQVDCDNPTKVIGETNPAAIFAIYQTPPGYTPRMGLSSIQHGMTLTNNGNIAVNAWLQFGTSATPSFPAGLTALQNAYKPIDRTLNTTSLAKSIACCGASDSWSSQPISLSSLANGANPTKYAVTVTFNATNSTYSVWGSDVSTTDFNVTAESVSISGNINLN